MDKTQLSFYLKNHHNKQEILNLSALVSGDEIAVKAAFDLCYDKDEQIAFRAAWVLENVIFNNELLFDTLFMSFFKKYHAVKNDSVKRHFSKIALHLLQTKRSNFYKLASADLDILLHTSFDWLLTPQTPLAVQCNCLEIVYQLSENEDWVLEELKPILERNFLSPSPAIISRTKKILKQLKRKK